MEYVEVNPKKPDHIALSFSGGGFRAASYTLGCLSYMETAELGGRKFTSLIHFISSASGGTITNLAYTSSQRKAVPFKQFYKNTTEQMLQGSNLINRVFEIMNDKNCWAKRPLKSRNLINAFSIAYDEMLFHEETFGIYWNQKPNVVAEVCANSTEFDDAMLFRFQNAGVAGNKFLYFKNEPAAQNVLKNIKLGDILACSSCFPVGFEPFIFPKDFTYAEIPQTALENAIKQDPRFSSDKNDDGAGKPPCFGFMDGGIDDNQGIDSFIRAEERMQTKNDFGYDLYISCDVSSNYTGGYDFPEENKHNFFERPSLLHYLLLILFAFGISLAGVTKNIYKEFAYLFLGISGFLLVLIIWLSIKGFKAYRKSLKTENTFGILIFRHLYFFLKLRLSTLLQLLDSRATSAGYLAAVVFLKKIRRISYDRLFEKISERKLKANGQMLRSHEDESLATTIELKHWRQFSLQNAIYLLSHKNDRQREMDLKKEKWVKENPIVTDDQQVALLDLLKPSVQLQMVADLAAEMDTTLWYDENHIKDNKPAALIATGQFTTCYNLLRYAFRFDRKDPYWSAFQTKLVIDWQRFQQSPYWLYEQYENLP